MATLARILQAEAFFNASHGTQMYGPGLPYLYHLRKTQIEAEQWYAKLGLDGLVMWLELVTLEDIAIAALGHDVIEDTNVTREQLRALYGPIVEEAIWACTDARLPPNPDGSRLTRKQKKWGTPTNPGPMLKLKNSRLGLYIKLCDRIVNVNACIAAATKCPNERSTRQLEKYRAEQADLRSLRTHSPLGPVWDHLEALLA